MKAGRISAGLLGLVGGLALGGCGFPGPASQGQQAVLQGCRAAADRAYKAQNRYQLSERDSRDTPFSGSGQVATPSDGLADQYTHENRVEDCVRRDGLTGEVPASPALAPAATP